jgi:hypothetical protein
LKNPSFIPKIINDAIQKIKKGKSDSDSYVTTEDITNNPINILPWFFDIYLTLGLAGIFELFIIKSSYIFGFLQKMFFGVFTGLCSIIYSSVSSITNLFLNVGNKVIVSPIVKSGELITEKIIPETANAIVEQIRYNMGITPPPPPSTMELIN